MITVPRFPLGLALAATALIAPAPLVAQAMVQAVPGTTDADRLAEQMRALAANPNDVAALATAGELSLKVDDLSGAASLFARADKVDSHNGRVKAGMASILVRSERPGEALRYFAVAESDGAAPRAFAADRGLAYDLIGQQDRAQRDYRLALTQGADAETIRRYALSLGISGKRDTALAQLDPLLRQNDRGAWRARAFVLAMTGDQAGADRIATTMMPPGLAEGLMPFFQRLPALGAADRAFAVHFGEIVATPERLADARLAPMLAPLVPEPVPVALAAATPAASARQDRRARDRDRKAKRGQQLAAATVTAVAPADTPAAPAYRAPVAPLPTGSAPATTAPADRPLTPAEAASLVAARGGSVRRTGRRPPVATDPTRVAMVDEPATPGVTRASPPASSPATAPAAVTPPPAVVAVTPPPAVAAVTPPPAVAAVTPPPPVAVTSVEPMPGAARLAAAGATPPAMMPSVLPSSVPPGAVATPTAAPVVLAAIPSPIIPPAPSADAAAPPNGSPPVASPVSMAGPAMPAAPASPSQERASEDTILARIIAGLSIPAAELGVTQPERPARAIPAPDTAARVVAEAKAKEARDAAAQKVLATRTAADRRALAREDASFKRAMAATKLAAAKKLADAKAAADEKKAARSNPARLWVQVAGGANEDDLPKAWKAVKAKAPAVFGTRQGWWTPLRATNRVLAGPFATETAARTFVNQLGKAGIAAFSFTSDAGQAVMRLPAE